MSNFTQLKLIDPLLKALHDLNYQEPTPIQKMAIPPLLEKKDLMGCAQTGTGKTAAFALPILQNLSLSNWGVAGSKPSSKEKVKLQVLILTPTRELAIQIQKSFADYGQHLPFKTIAIFGGVSQVPQVKQLQQGVEILIATPGRLLDLIQQRLIQLNHVKTFVLDEADRMLDMGFLPDVKRILPLLPQQRQNLFFSATLDKEIKKLSESILKNPTHVEVTPEATTAEKIKQHLLFVEKAQKRDLLKHLLQSPSFYKVIVFTRTKHGANRLAELLQKNKITSEAIHGDKSQGARQRALENFRIDKLRVLIATDLAARGLDIDGVTHVINFDIPHQAESYVHRIGRTARAGAEGEAYSFCDREEKSFLKDIEKKIGMKIPVVTDHPYHSPAIEGANTVSVGKAKAMIEQKENKPQARRQFKSRDKSRDQRSKLQRNIDKQTQSTEESKKKKKPFFRFNKNKSK